MRTFMLTNLWRRTCTLYCDDPSEPSGTPAAAPEGSTPINTETAPEWATPPALPFELSSIEDEQARQYLQARSAQLQSGFTKAVQTAQEKAKEAQALLDLKVKLEDPAQRNTALAEFLSAYDIDLEFEGDPTAEPTGEAETTEPLSLDALPAEVRQELEEGRRFREEETARREQQAKTDQEAAIRGHLRDGLTKFAVDENTTLDELPEHVVDDILARATALPRSENGLPDVDQAIADFIVHREALVSAAVEAERRKLASKDVPTPDLTSTAADDAPPAGKRTRAERLTAALAVAGKHT